MKDHTPENVPVSVVIPAYDSANTLRHTLEQICACDPLPEEILIHCDGGWILPDEVIQGLALPVRVLQSSDNLGPGGGRHRLFLEASCELIASFDDDSWPLDREYFAQVCAVMEAFPQVAVMSPAVYLHEKPVLAPFHEAYTARSFEGSASVHRKSVYLTLPGYVSVPAAYGVEEADLSLQIHAAGHEMLSCPWLRAWHDRPYADHQHTVLPWIRNEVLLAYLRFPYIAQPWGWFRSLRHILRHRKEIPLRCLLRELALSLPHAASFKKLVKRYSLADVWRHHRHSEKRHVMDVAADGTIRSIRPAVEFKRVLYIQYTNPGGYPPLEYSARILARAGWEVEFLGLNGSGEVTLDFAPHPRLSVKRMSYQNPGLVQKLHYMAYTLWCLWRVLCWRPHWLYASDTLAAPAALLIKALTKTKILYHEHDSPTPGMMQESRILKHVLNTRLRLARWADLVVVPNQKRMEALMEAAGASGRSACVWNCPSLDGIPVVLPERPVVGPLKVIYHGSIVPDRFGRHVLEAVARCGREIHIKLIGYFPIGHEHHLDELNRTAADLGVKDQFQYLGSMSHHEVLECSKDCDVGLAMLRIHDGDINMKHMVGASNKPFDYLSRGLALIVPPDSEWENLYVQAGCAKTCPMNDPAALAEVFCWMADHRHEVAQMGKLGHQMMLQHWHYEKQFGPVLQEMQNSSHQKS